MDIKRYDFDYRIAEVMPMLEEKQLYGTKALIRDLKRVVNEIEEIRNKTIDEFAERVITQYHQLPTTLGYTEQIIREIAEQMKAGGK